MTDELLKEILIEIQRLNTRLLDVESSQKPALTVEEAGQWLGCGRTQIHQLLRAGRLRKLPRLGRKTRLSVSSVKRLVIGSKPEPKQSTHERTPRQSRVQLTSRSERIRRLRDEMMKITL